jgi:hypothetical protein
MRGGRTAATTLTAMALLIAGCGQAPSVQVDSHAGALDAIADSFAGSWAWQGRLEVDIADEDLLTAGEVERQGLVWLEQLSAHSAHGALGDDGSWRTALVDGDTTWLDVRLGVGELLAADSLAPEASAYLRLDLPYLARNWGMFLGDLGQLRAELERELEGSAFLDVAVAIFDGGWGGLTGVLDLAAMGVTDADLEEARREFQQDLIGVADRATMRALLDEATTLRSFEQDPDGGSVAVLDVHPRDAARAVYDLFDDAAWLAGAHPADADALPRTLEAVATVRFDQAGMLTEVATDVLAIARQLEDHGLAGIEDLPSEASTIAVVFGFSRHGEVATVVDLPDAVTTSWGEVAEAFASLWLSTGGDVYTEGEVTLESEVEAEAHLEDAEIDVHEEVREEGTATPTDEVQWARMEVLSHLGEARAALEWYREQHGVYAAGALAREYGFEERPDVTLTIGYLDDEDYCIEGAHDAVEEAPLGLVSAYSGLLSGDEGLTCDEMRVTGDRG